MRDSNNRPTFGPPEYGLAAALVLVIAVAALAARAGHPIVLVPAIGVALIFGAAYALHRLHAREAAGLHLVESAGEAAVPIPIPLHAREAPKPVAAAFRIVGAHGAICPRGCGIGQIVTLDATGRTSPQLCPAAEAVLRMAASGEAAEPVKEWCCPIHDHLLVFRRVEQQVQEARAA